MTEPKKFGFIPVASLITPVPPGEIARESQKELLHLGGGHFNENQINEKIPLFYFILTGGTEQKVFSLWKERKEKLGDEPVALLAHPGNNSLPASFEILARLKQEGAKGSIIYLDYKTNKECWNEVHSAVKYLGVFHQLRKSRIGLIGKPSDWLIASMPDYEKIKTIWGPEIVEIEIEELKKGIEEITEAEIEETQFQFTENAAEIKEPSKKDIKNVVRVYAALKKIIKKYNLSAVTVRCFDLVVDLKTTGCFALSKLNDDGIVAGCEGDLVSALGMLWANLLTDQSAWMANPSRIDEQNNSMWLAHCTVPLGMVDKYILRSHFESGLGVGIEGELSKGKATLLRLGGVNTDKLWISNVEIIESGSEENLCRTQVHLKLHGNYKVSDLLKEPFGNHMILIRGSYVKEMQKWFEDFIE
jgi:L-fucose isomerase-like protein